MDAPATDRFSDNTRGSIHGFGGGRFGCFRESRGCRGGSYQDTRSQRSSARGGGAGKASTVRMEGFVALVIGHRSCSPLFDRGVIACSSMCEASPSVRQKRRWPHAELSLPDAGSRSGRPEPLRRSTRTSSLWRRAGRRRQPVRQSSVISSGLLCCPHASRRLGATVSILVEAAARVRRARQTQRSDTADEIRNSL